MSIRQVDNCPKCDGRMFEGSAHGIFHADTGTQTCPSFASTEQVRAIVQKILDRDRDLLDRLAE